MIIVSYGGCVSPESIIELLTGGASGGADPAVQAEFDAFLEDQFREEVSASSIDLNYSVRHPENYGIERIEPTLGEFGIEAFREIDEKNRKALDELKSFRYTALTEEQQQVYDILKYDLEVSLEFEGFDYYSVILSPTVGLQAELPFVFAEYHFFTEEDVTDYLALLSELDQYLQDVLQFEREKSDLGLFMADFTVDAIIKSCNEFMESKEDNFLIETFESRLEGLDLSAEQKTALIEENRDKILNEAIPAYARLVEGLEKLKGTGKNDGGLCNFEEGKKYYEILVKDSTGSGKSIREISDLVDGKLRQAFYTIGGVLQNNPDAYDYWLEPEYGVSGPAETMEFLIGKIADTYPVPADVAYTLKYIHPSLEESSSPAFYMIPPLDDFSNNVVYINNSYADSGSLYSIAAHEGFPGHLYQSTYFFSKNPNPIRYVLMFNGYMEGWATYAELDAVNFADFPEMKEDLAALLAADSIISLSVYARADIGVNYEGWTAADIQNYLDAYGVGSEEFSQSVFESVVMEPANTLKYIIGYFEFEELYDYASNELGDRFSQKDFHRSVLDIGPAPFPIVRKAVEQYVSEKKKGL